MSTPAQLQVPGYQVIEAELDWLRQIVETRLALFLDNPAPAESVFDIPPPSHSGSEAPYSRFVTGNDVTHIEEVLLALALAPYLRPAMLNMLNVVHPTTGLRYTEFGIVPGNRFHGFLPTLETLCFLLADDLPGLRAGLLSSINHEHWLFKSRLLLIDPPLPGEPPQSALFSVSEELLASLLHGTSYEPSFSSSFPAKRITTRQTWDDLVLEDAVRAQVGELNAWIEFGHELHSDWGLGSKIMPGHRSLFHGPSGTGKTLTATLLGQQSGMDVYRIDLSMVVSKYIGETEKNLSRIFDLAEHRNWILFFDEADALFGKRTNVKDAHDRYANQEISFLLQRVEDYNGLVILATNLKANIDEAFARRFQSVINFPMPRAPQREQLWRNMFSPKMHLAPGINLKDIARNYELSGGSIINVVQYCSLMALSRKSDIIALADISEGIKREFAKAGKAM